MKTYSPISGMHICADDTGPYVEKADYDRLLAKYRTAFVALTHIAAGSTHPSGVASDAVQSCIDKGDTCEI